MLYPQEIHQHVYKDLFKFSVKSAVDGSLIPESQLIVSKRNLKGDFVEAPKSAGDLPVEELAKELKFGYTVVKHTAKEIVVELSFNDPRQVSNSRYGMDELRVALSNVTHFRSSETFKAMNIDDLDEDGKVLKFKIRPIIYDEKQVQ